MLGSMLELPGFHAETLQQIRAAIAPDLQAWARQGLGNEVEGLATWEVKAAGSGQLERIAEIGIHAGDPIVRRSRPLQKTADGRAARAARLNPATAAAMGLAAGDLVRVEQGGEARLAVALDAGTPQGCVRIARGVADTVALTSGDITIDKVREAAAAE
jgi:NADH-quinone oxidoreductase subunit G